MDKLRSSADSWRRASRWSIEPQRMGTNATEILIRFSKFLSHLRSCFPRCSGAIAKKITITPPWLVSPSFGGIPGQRSSWRDSAVCQRSEKRTKFLAKKFLETIRLSRNFSPASARLRESSGLLGCTYKGIPSEKTTSTCASYLRRCKKTYLPTIR